MKNKYFNKLTISLFVLGIILIILALSPIGSLSENIVDFVNNLLASFGVSFIMLAITISFIQYYLDQQQLTIIEKYEKKKEQEYILNHHKILSILIHRYKIVFSNLIRNHSRNITNLDFNREFDFKDLSELYEINGFVTTNLFSTKIEVFYKGEELLIKYVSQLLGNNEFKFNKNLEFILTELLKVSLKHDEIKDGILSNIERKDIVESIIKNDLDYVSMYLSGNLRGNLSIPYVELYLFLKEQRKLIVEYLEEIRKIQQEE